MDKHVLCVIPARYASQRLPGKPLMKINGVPLIVWVYNNAVASGAFDEVCVATDDTRIAEAVENAGGRAEMTSGTHESGTDRIHEVARRIPCTHLVNLQGDEPQIPAELLKQFSDNLLQIDDNSLLTVVGHATIVEKAEPDCVKVVMDRRGRALYFSRAGIPFVRDGGNGSAFKHMGIYGFTARSLDTFCSFPEGKLERQERLEQLRALENGMIIQCLQYDFTSIGIDTPEDLERFREAVAG